MSNYKELREAFVAGAKWDGLLVYSEAGRRYPAPMVERPRVVAVEDARIRYRVNDGKLQFNYPDSGTRWYNYDGMNRCTVAALLNLFDHPTELVEVED